MQEKLLKALFSILVAVVFLFFGCAGMRKPQPVQEDSLDRWLSKGTATEESIPLQPAEAARQVALESLSPPTAPSSGEGFPAPEYFSFTLDEPERVAVTVKSDAGAAIALMDRASGVLARDGSIGRRDGRIDILLDAGEYRVESRTLREEDRPDIRVTAFASVPVDAGLLMHSPPGDFHEGRLGDLEQCSYWISVADDEPIVLEALGRSLSEVRIWKDGVWILAERPTVKEYAPQSGRIMGYAEVYLTPGEGNYLVTFYGGPMRPWEDENDENPFYVRRGAVYLGETVDANTVISPMGRDAFIVSGDATVFEVENPDFEPVTIGVSGRLSGGRFAASRRASVTRDAESTRARLTTSQAKESRWLYVQGTPGDAVHLRAIPSREYYYIEDPPAGSRYLVSTVSSLDADHAIDATAMVIRGGDGKEKRDEVVRSSFLTAGADKPLYREINSSGQIAFVVDLDVPGKWSILHSNDDQHVAASFIPLREVATVDEPEQKTTNPAVFNLEAGPHLVILWTGRPGVLKFVLHHGSYRNPSALFDTPAPLPRQDFTFITDTNEIFPGSKHVILINPRGGPVNALFVEQLPLSLEKPVPLTLAAGEELEIPVRPRVRGTLSSGYASVAIEREGVPLTDDKPLDTAYSVLAVKNNGEATRTFVLRLDPLPEKSFTVPEIPELVDLFPLLLPGEPVYFDCRKDESRRFLLQVRQPGFYRLMTTGRLSTRISTRTRVTVDGARAEMNGPGRNAMVLGFFRTGTYLVEARTLGPSAGRMGLVMEAPALEDLGSLAADTWYRSKLPAESGLTATMAVAEPGRFSFTSFGLYGSSKLRVEDADGWPLQDDRLGRGLYRLYAWPQDVPNRRLTGWFRKASEENLPEDGVWPVELNGSISRVWMESEGRRYQEFSLVSPAALPVSLRLPGGMEWRIVAAEGDILAEGTGKGECKLPPGKVRILVRSREVNNRVSYTLTVNTAVLADGLEQKISRFPGKVEVRIDQPGIYDFWSFGSRDIRARLLTADESRELASGDDRPGDWNFFLSRYLPAGTYSLEVEESFAGSGNMSVFCRFSDEVRTEERSLPLETRLRLEDAVVGIPFVTGAEDAITLIRCGSAAGLSLYRDGRFIAEGSGLLAVPLEAGATYLLRLRNGSLEPADVDLSVLQPPAERISWNGEGALNLDSGAFRVDLAEGPSARSSSPGLFVSAGLDTPASPLKGEVAAPRRSSLWCWNEKPEKGMLSPFELQPGALDSLLIGGTDILGRIPAAEGRVYLLTAESMGGFIGLDLPGSGETSVHRWTAADTIRSSTLIGIPGEKARLVRFWDGEALSSGRRTALHLKSFPVDSSADPTGEILTLEPGTAAELNTGKEDYLSVLLSPGMAVFSDDGTFVARNVNRSVLLGTEGGVWVVNNGKRRGTVRMRAGDPPQSYALTQGAPLEMEIGGGDTVSIRLDPGVAEGDNETLFWAEDVREAGLLTDSGRRVVARPIGDSSPWYSLPAVPGRLLLEAAPGPAAVWFGSPETKSPEWMLRGTGFAAGELLPGENRLEAKPERRRFTLEEERFVVLSTESPGITVLMREGEPLSAAVGAGEGRKIIRLLPAGTYEVVNRPIAGMPQESPLQFQALLPRPLSEKDESPVLFLEAGERAVFSVDVTEKVPVGVGLDGESDFYDTVLLNSSMKIIGTGRYFYRAMEPGRYYLLVKNGPHPLHIRAVSAGDTGSLRGIPAAVIQNYRGD